MYIYKRTLNFFFFIFSFFYRMFLYIIESFTSSNDIELVNRHIYFFSGSVLKISETKVILNQSKIILNQKESYVLISNHPSLIDIPIILNSINVITRMIFKDQLLKVPLFGYALKRSGFIAVNRGNRKKAISQLNSIKENYIKKNNISIWLSPEGTRSPLIGLNNLKKGFIHLSQKLYIKIIPIGLIGGKTIINLKKMQIYKKNCIFINIGTFIHLKKEQNLDKLIIKIKKELQDLTLKY